MSSLNTRLRSRIRNTINETSVYDVFVAPFEDVLASLPLVVSQVVSVVRLNVTVLLALDPGKMEKAMDEYDKRQERIDAKWEPIMKNNMIAASQGDLGAVAFALNPGAFLGSSAIRAVYNNAGNIKDWAKDSGLDKGMLSMLPGVGAGKSDYDDDGKPDDDPKGLITSTLEKLASIFFVYTPTEGRLDDLSLPLLVEEEKKKPPFDQALAQYLEETGLQQVFDDLKSETIDVQKERAKKIFDMVSEKLDTFEKLLSSSDLDALVAGLQEVSPEQAQKANEIEANLAKVENELKKSEEFIEQLKSEKKEGEELSQEEITKAAKKVAFSKSKEGLQKQLSDAIKDKKTTDQLLKQTQELIYKDLPFEDNKAMSLIEKDKASAEMLEQFEKVIDEIKKKITKLQSIA